MTEFEPRPVDPDIFSDIDRYDLSDDEWYGEDTTDYDRLWDERHADPFPVAGWQLSDRKQR